MDLPVFKIFYTKAKTYESIRVKRSEIEDMINRIKKFDQEGKDLIYVLIKAYSLYIDKKELTEDLPYESVKIGSESYVFDTRKFPQELNRILILFTESHVTRLKESEKRYSQ